MLEPLLDSPVKEKILLAVLARGESYPRELARTFGLPVYAVQYQLGRLERGGVLYSRLRGRTRLYGFNPRYPFLRELRALLGKARDFYAPDERAAWFEPRLRPRRAGKPL
jgi:DNA-binding transcriptional ArsR family regulator